VLIRVGPGWAEEKEADMVILLRSETRS
jgi:hypothetical protein